MISDDQAFLLLKRRIMLDRGLDCEQYKVNYLKRRIAVRLRATGCESYSQYLGLLKKDPGEYAHLLRELTINVTQFFRDGDVYGRLRESVVPSLVEAKRAIGSRTIRAWSAGCSSGEEAYSLAILIDEVLGADSKRWNVRVLGTDYDDGCLAVARGGAYRDLKLPGDIELRRHFDVRRRESGTEYSVLDELKGRVRFRKQNLLEHQPKRHFDLVLCRNVLIYFDRQVQGRIIESLARSIIGEGYLVLGKSETAGTELPRLLRPVFPTERIYQVVVEERFNAKRKRSGQPA